jgi:hypothetical protein
LRELAERVVAIADPQITPAQITSALRETKLIDQ